MSPIQRTVYRPYNNTDYTVKHMSDPTENDSKQLEQGTVPSGHVYSSDRTDRPATLPPSVYKRPEDKSRIQQLILHFRS